MVKLLTAVFGTLLIGSSVSQAGVTYVSQTRARAGHATVADVSPIPSPEGDLEGVLLCDSTRAALTILTPDWDTAYTLPLSRPAKAAVAFRSADGDTLFFCAVTEGDIAPLLYLVARADGRTSVVSRLPHTNRPLGRLLSRTYGLTVHPQSGASGVVVLTISDVIEEHLVTQGTLTEARARAFVFDLAERDFTFETAADNLAAGEFDGDGAVDLAGSRVVWSRWGTPESGDRNPAAVAAVELGVAGRASSIVQHRLDGSRVQDLALLDLSPFIGSDELVVAGSGVDWLANHAGRQNYLAAYSYSAGQVEELWYRRHEPTTLIVPFLFRWQLAVFRAQDRVLFYDPGTGDPVDSVVLDRALSDARVLFNPGNRRALFLTGRSGDTLITARIDQETIRSAQSDRPETAMPETFSLEQNYPNPFNGATRLRFENKVGQHLSLRIYNVLGQEIATLVDYVLPPGEYDYSWDATNNFGEIQGSGIYFAQLKSSSESHIIKLIYLK